MKFFRNLGKFMMAGAVAHARWEMDVSNTILHDRKRLLLLALLIVPVLIGGYAFADQVVTAFPDVLGGKKAYSPAHYSTGIFIVSILIGLGAGGDAGAEMGAIVGAVSALDEYEYGLDDEALATIAADIPAGGAALLLVVEHTWMIPVRDAIRAQGGIVVAQDFLSPEALIAFGAEAALED